MPDERRLNEHFRTALMEVIPCAVFILDADQKVTYWNPAAEELTGYGSDEMLGATCDMLGVRLLSEDDPEVLRALCPAHEGGPGWDEECEIQRKDGRRVPVLRRARPVRDERGRGIGAIQALVDVSVVKQYGSENRRLRREIARVPPRSRAVRTRPRRLHRGHLGPARSLRGGRRRDALPRRGRRNVPSLAGQAPPRGPGRSDHARRREPASRGRRPGDRRQQPQPPPAGPPGAVPRGPLLPPPRGGPARPRPARAKGGHPRPGQPFHPSAERAVRTADRRVRAPGDGAARGPRLAGQRPRAGARLGARLRGHSPQAERLAAGSLPAEISGPGGTGREADRLVGLHPREVLLERLRPYLAASPSRGAGASDTEA